MTTKCPYLAECLALMGMPIGMHHCPYCGEMVIGGMDTAPHCKFVFKEDEHEDT